jgi:hypothetical protein
MFKRLSSLYHQSQVDSMRPLRVDEEEDWEDEDEGEDEWEDEEEEE